MKRLQYYYCVAGLSCEPCPFYHMPGNWNSGIIGNPNTENRGHNLIVLPHIFTHTCHNCFKLMLVLTSSGDVST